MDSNKGEEEQPTGPARIVIADDHPLFRAALRQLLSEHSSELVEVVAEASDGREAVELCRSLRPELVLMDVEMPTMSGIEAARQIKREAPSTIVLMLTAFENPDYLLEAIKAGASGYVLKYESTPQIVEAIYRALSGDSPLNSAVVMQLIGRLIEEKEEGPTTPRRSLPAEQRQQDQQPVAVSLSEQEIEILKLMAQGKNNREIASSLWVSLSTVKRYVRHILTALGASDRVQAILLAIELGILNSNN